ncbi:MAG: pyruvate, water dikinase regulatory protein [Candidatus Zixiibacteriota bacterium]
MSDQVEFPPIYIVSGGTGDSGMRLVESVLVQYPGVEMPIHKRVHVYSKEQIDTVIAEAQATNGTIVHTLVSYELRKYLRAAGKKLHITTIDLMHDLFIRLDKVLDRKPIEKPGLYRAMRQSYFDRIDAIDFTLKHDDGKYFQELHEADIVITGVSRTGKTPLSMYLAVQGWKVANVPITVDTPVPEEIALIDRKRVFGLNIDLDQILDFRHKRQEKMGIGTSSDYTNPKAVYEELEFALGLFKKYRFSIIDVTNKPIESSAGEIIESITRRLED